MAGKLRQIAEARGVEVIDRGNGHWQIKGPLLVNYYPDSKSKSAYVAGTKKARKCVTPEEAVDMCFQAPEFQGEKDKRKKNSRNKRAALIKKGVTSCYWCGKPLTLDDSTLEHKIPLAIGGLDNANNRTLACADCNHGRGNKMPELGKHQGYDSKGRGMSFDSENYNDDFSPKACFRCGGVEFTENIKSSVESHVLEYEVICKSCGQMCGYWVHGHYDPCFSDLSNTI